MERVPRQATGRGQTLDPDRCYKALLSRDQRFDGSFFTGVTTTGIYCRPVCPARTPKRSNVRFFRHAAAAEDAGFRACRRCRPEAAPGSAAWDPAGDLVSRALQLVDDGALDHGSVAALAGRLHVTERHLRRLFDERVGASPIAVARTRRAHLARRLLDETDLAVTDVCFAAGFGSVRQFNDVMRASFAAAPSMLRDGRRRRSRWPEGTPLTVRLPFRAPLDWEATTHVLSVKTTALVEVVEGQHYRRTVPGGWVEIRPGGDRQLLLDAHVGDVGHLSSLVARARALFDLDADTETIGEHLAVDPFLRPLVLRHPGLRVLGAWDGFETAVRAVVGQLVSVRGATTTAGKVAAALGGAADTGVAGLDRLWPGPEALVDAELEAVGMTRAKATAIRSLAAAVIDGRVALDGSMLPADLATALVELPGIGPWTADIVRMRVSRDPDAFVPGDLGVRRALGGVGVLEADARSQAWRPWRAYAAMYLWRSIS